MIPLFKVYMPPTIDAEMSKVLHSGYVAEGDYVRLFERRMQKLMFNEKVLTTNSCTSALHLALKLSDVGVGDAVITTSMTCLATNVSITNMSAIPIWADVDPLHGMLTPETLERALKYAGATLPGSKVKAVIHVCWGGDLGPIEEVYAVCKKYDVKLIIDAAQAFGARYNLGQNVLGDGTCGDFVCFSFQAIKHITTGDGGAIAFADENDFKRAFKLKWFGIDREGFRTPSGEINWTSDVPEVGYKFHMNNIAGVIGAEQLNPANDFQTRLNTYFLNDVILRDALEENTPLVRTWRKGTAAWVSTFWAPDPIELLGHLKTKDIHASQMHVNNDVYTGFKGAHASCELVGVKEFMAHHICIPCGWWLSEEDGDNLIESIMEFYKQ